MPYAFLTEDDGTYHDLKGQLDTIDAVLDAIKAQTDKLSFDASNNLKVNM